MQTNKINIADEMFKTADAITNVSRTANLYGKLLAVKDMQIYLIKQETEINEQIKKAESNV